MHRSAFKCRTARSAGSAGTNWILGYKILKLLRSVEGRHHPQQLAVEAPNESSVGPTQPNRTFGDGFKHPLKIECRAADNLKHVRRRGLLLQKFSKIGRTLTQFVEQPCVLNGDAEGLRACLAFEARYGAFALRSCAVALWLVGRLLWSAVASPTLRLRTTPAFKGDYSRDLRPAKWASI